MSQLCKTVLDAYQTRRTTKQKTAFIELLQAHIPELRVEQIGKSRNLIAGDISTAQIIFTAHYDTAARSWFPNISVPFHKGLKFLLSMVPVIPAVVLALVANAIVARFSDDLSMRLLIVLGVYYGVYAPPMFFGPPNNHTANDNTSGICLLIQLLETLTEEQRRKVAFVFFDNEEQGCVGSAAFRKLHKAETENKLIFNFDCIADGDHVLFIATDPAEKQWFPVLQQVFENQDGKTVAFANKKKALYSSDQKRFPVSIGAAALHEHPLFGLYFSRIHTARDTVFQEENIAFLKDGIIRLIERM